MFASAYAFSDQKKQKNNLDERKEYDKYSC